MKQKQYTLVIDTEQYSGNFEVEMTAWVTGLADSEGRGEAFARKAQKTIPQHVQDWFEEHTRSDGEYNDCCGSMLTPGWLGYGNGKTYKEGDPAAPATDMHWQANLSVGIYLDARPPKEILEFVKTRALEFNQRPVPEWDTVGPVTVTGFRLVTETIEDKSEVL